MPDTRSVQIKLPYDPDFLNNVDQKLGFTPGAFGEDSQSAPPPAAAPLGTATGGGGAALHLMPQPLGDLASSKLSPIQSGSFSPSPAQRPRSLGRKVAGVLGQIGGYALGAVAPGIAAMIPSTPLGRLYAEERVMERQRALQGQAAQQSEIGLRGAQAEHLRAETESLRQPQPKAPATVETGTGQRLQFNPETGTYDKPVGGPRPLPEKTTRYEARTIAGPDGKPIIVNYDPMTGRHTDVQGNFIANPQPYEKQMEPVGKMAPEIEAQIGPVPTGHQFGGKTYATPEEARAAWGRAAEQIKNRESAATGMARGEAFGSFRPVNVIDPQTGEAKVMFAKTAIEAGAAPVAAGMQIMGKQAQFSEMHVAAQKARAAIQSLDRDFTPAQIGKLTLAFRQDDPTVFRTEIETLMGTQQLTPAQEDFVVWITQLNERAMSLRNVAGMGQGSDDLRKAIRATLPGVKSGSKNLALKQLDAFENQVTLLERGVPKIRGSAAGGAAPAPAPEGRMSVKEWMQKRRGK